LRDYPLGKIQRVLAGFSKPTSRKGQLGLTADLRAALISLLLWVESHTKAVLSGSKNVEAFDLIIKSLYISMGSEAGELPKVAGDSNQLWRAVTLNQ